MRRLTDKEFLKRKAFIYATNNYNNVTNCFISTYKNYSYCITNFYNNFCFMSITIFKLTKEGNIKVVYENNNLEDIIKLFGKNFRNNSINTVRRKIGEFIKIYLES